MNELSFKRNGGTENDSQEYGNSDHHVTQLKELGKKLGHENSSMTQTETENLRVSSNENETHRNDYDKKDNHARKDDENSWNSSSLQSSTISSPKRSRTEFGMPTTLNHGDSLNGIMSIGGGSGIQFSRLSPHMLQRKEGNNVTEFSSASSMGLRSNSFNDVNHQMNVQGGGGDKDNDNTRDNTRDKSSFDNGVNVVQEDQRAKSRLSDKAFLQEENQSGISLSSSFSDTNINRGSHNFGREDAGQLPKSLPSSPKTRDSHVLDSRKISSSLPPSTSLPSSIFNFGITSSRVPGAITSGRSLSLNVSNESKHNNFPELNTRDSPQRNSSNNRGEKLSQSPLYNRLNDKGKQLHPYSSKSHGDMNHKVKNKHSPKLKLDSRRENFDTEDPIWTQDQHLDSTFESGEESSDNGDSFENLSAYIDTNGSGSNIDITFPTKRWYFGQNQVFRDNPLTTCYDVPGISSKYWTAAASIGSSKHERVGFKGGPNEDRIEICEMAPLYPTHSTLNGMSDESNDTDDYKTEHPWLFIGAYDGHGGSGAASDFLLDYLKNEFADYMRLYLKEATSSDMSTLTREALIKSFISIDVKMFIEMISFCQEEGNPKKETDCTCRWWRENPCACLKPPISANQGSTSTVVIIQESKIFAANVGDSDVLVVSEATERDIEIEKRSAHKDYVIDSEGNEFEIVYIKPPRRIRSRHLDHSDSSDTHSNSHTHFDFTGESLDRDGHDLSASPFVQTQNINLFTNEERNKLVDTIVEDEEHEGNVTADDDNDDDDDNSDVMADISDENKTDAEFEVNDITIDVSQREEIDNGGNKGLGSTSPRKGSSISIRRPTEAKSLALKVQILTAPDTPLADEENEDFLRIRDISRWRIQKHEEEKAICEREGRPVPRFKIRRNVRDGILQDANNERFNYVCFDGARSLNMVRAFGNFGNKFIDPEQGTVLEHVSPVISRPHTIEIDRTPNMRYLVIGTDGLWDNLKNDEIVNVVENHIRASPLRENAHKTARAASRELLEMAKAKKWKPDDVSVIVVFLPEAWENSSKQYYKRY